MDIKATHVQLKGKPEVVWTEESGGEVLHYTVVTDRGVNFDSALQKLNDAKSSSEECEDGGDCLRQTWHLIRHYSCGHH